MNQSVAVRESEERFRMFANSIPQLVSIAGADGSFLWYNQRWYDYTGATQEQMEGRGWQSVHDPAVLPTVLSKWRDAIALAQPFEMEFPLRAADGTFHNFLTRVQPVKDSEGRLVQWFGTTTDVDQLKRIEQLLRVTQARLESALEASSVGTWTWHIASDRLIADEFTARLFSVAADAAAEGLPVAAYMQVLHEEDRAEVADALGRAIQLCSDYDIEYRVRQSDGTFRWVQARGRVESDDAGQATYFHGAVIDITDRKLSALRDFTERKRVEGALRERDEKLDQLNAALEQRVIERTGELEAANTELEAFSYTVSHDLRAPLRTINAFAKLVLDRYGLQVPVDAEAREFLELIRQGGQQMEQLIDDLLAFSQFSRQSMNRQAVNCGELVQAVLDQSVPQREGRRIEFNVGDLPACRADEALLKQVWVNLISNAIKYTRGRDETVIEIGCQHGSSEIVYFVRDNGAGFDMQYVNKLFGVFQRLHGADEFEGTGVGLAIVQRIVNRHGGRIWAEAAVGCGATFYFTLESDRKVLAPLV